MSQETSGYWRAEDVLPLNIIEEVGKVLTSSMKITFAASHRPYNRSEAVLPNKLVDRVREALDKADVTKRRIILFRSRKDHDGGPHHAIALAKRGFPQRVIADALGYNPRTMSRWNLKEHMAAEPAAAAANAATLSAGFARFQELHPGEVEEVDYYQLLGTAVLLMNTPEYKAEVEAAEKASVPRPKRW